MPECTAFGVKSSSSTAPSSGTSLPEPPQPAAARANANATARASRRRTPGIVAPDAPPRHLLAQSDAVAVADVPVLLQVLRVRHAPPAPARARRGGDDLG